MDVSFSILYDALVVSCLACRKLPIFWSMDSVSIIHPDSMFSSTGVGHAAVYVHTLRLIPKCISDQKYLYGLMGYLFSQ